MRGRWSSCCKSNCNDRRQSITVSTTLDVFRHHVRVILGARPLGDIEGCTLSVSLSVPCLLLTPERKFVQSLNYTQVPRDMAIVTMDYK